MPGPVRSGSARTIYWRDTGPAYGGGMHRDRTQNSSVPCGHRRGEARTWWSVICRRCSARAERETVCRTERPPSADRSIIFGSAGECPEPFLDIQMSHVRNSAIFAVASLVCFFFPCLSLTSHCSNVRTVCGRASDVAGAPLAVLRDARGPWADQESGVNPLFPLPPVGRSPLVESAPSQGSRTVRPLSYGRRAHDRLLPVTPHSQSGEEYAARP